MELANIIENHSKVVNNLSFIKIFKGFLYILHNDK
jgi:hypothetical protein